MSKCTKTHVRQCENPKIFPGVIPPDPRLQGREGREGRGGEGEWEGREGRRGRGENGYRGGGKGEEGGEGRRGRRGKREGRVWGIGPPILKSWIRHWYERTVRKDKPERVKWLPEHTAALEAIKQSLISKPLLVAPNSNKPFILQTDATANSVAAILTQLHDEGREHVICYASRKLLPREQRYSSMEQECLGIIFAVLK